MTGVCATNGRLANGPIWYSGEFGWVDSAKPSAITLRFDPPQLLSVTAHVGITNNAGKAAIDCAFSDGLFPDPDQHLPVTGDAEFRLTLPPPVKRIPYNITVSCPPFPDHKETKTF